MFQCPATEKYFFSRYMTYINNTGVAITVSFFPLTPLLNDFELQP